MSATHAVRLRVAPDHPALPGHFPGDPLVPGVVLLERVAAAWKAWRGVAVGRLDAKFLQPLRPGEDAVIALHDEDARVRFEVRRADGALLARGTLGAART
ncbi:MAG: hydroxymyristoyl-ACP dehydratase [Rhodanobacteraceae bacterium]|nr:MAG: hydroxymyristoyl-ACP dehydratase [Rhodanobacteraceae bacterium]